MVALTSAQRSEALGVLAEAARAEAVKRAQRRQAGFHRQG